MQCAQPGTYGFSCTGNVTPDGANYFCSSPTATSNGSSQYCCLLTTATTTCAADSSVAGCQAGSYGFSCTGSNTPDQTFTNLTCSSGTAAAGATLYCCADGTSVATGTCSADAAITGCVGGSSAYKCTGGITPDPSLKCSTGVAGPAGDVYYCCGGTGGTCSADSSVTGCTGGSSGFSCTGAGAPDATNLATLCSVGVAASDGSGTTLYCCFTNVSTTCQRDPTVQGCQSTLNGPAYGFSCSGTDSPSMDTPLTCSAGTPGYNGVTLYCCQ